MSTLFPPDLPERAWVEFSAQGFSRPAVGVIHRRSYPAACGMPLGGIDTGCLDLETSGLFGLCSIFNSHVPRRGALNLPFLGRPPHLVHTVLDKPLMRPPVHDPPFIRIPFQFQYVHNPLPRSSHVALLNLS